MRLACGLIFVFVAAILAWWTINNLYDAEVARNKTGIDGVAYRIFEDDKHAATRALKFGIGAVIFGLIGFVVLVAGGRAESSPSPETPATRTRHTQEERLATIQELLLSGLINEQEYQAKRRQIFDEL